MTPISTKPTSYTTPEDIAQAQADKLLLVPKKYHNHYRQAYSRKSMTHAIQAHCLECVNWQLSELHHCPVLSCPLYHYRLSKQMRKTLTQRVV